jgi:DMSO/TMAO reductase YedYZ molybdopterin-dependent catalytic subunit
MTAGSSRCGFVPPIDTAMLNITGEVQSPCSLSFADLAAVPDEHQIADVSRLVPGRKGDAVRLAGILELVRPKSNAKWLGLHAARDDFHASIPLAAVTDKALLIYRLDGQPLPENAGGPVRFFIPDFAACHTHEIDECANVKFVDRLEFTAEKGFDNRPHDGDEHAALHDRQR